MDGFLQTSYTQCSPCQGESRQKSCFGAGGEERWDESRPAGAEKNDKRTEAVKKREQKRKRAEAVRRREEKRRRAEAARKREEKRNWEMRAKRQKRFLDLAQKAWYRRENEREFQEHIAFARKEVSSAVLKKQSMERAAGEPVELDANPAVLSEAATEFARNYVFFKIPSARVNPRAGK